MAEIARLHNNPPDPIDEAMAPFDDDRAEAEGWLDGKPVETEGQMKAVDALIKTMKAAKKAVETAEESAAKPIYDQWKAEKAKFAPTISDLDRIIKGLVAAVDGFKRKLAAQKAEAERKAQAEAARMEAERLASVTAKQEEITDVAAKKYNERIARLRAAHSLRTQAGGIDGAANGEQVPCVPGATVGADGAPCPLSTDERLIAEEQAIRLEGLQDWVREQAGVQN
jgi:uncharacterized protein YhaN